jgi:hypothetical protein
MVEMVQLQTYEQVLNQGYYNEDNDFKLQFFEVPRDWLEKTLAKLGWEPVDQFLGNYTWDNSELIYDLFQREKN